MKNIKLALIVCSTMMVVTTAVHAQDDYKKSAQTHNFMSKRAYHQPLPDSAYENTKEWEGATLVSDESQTEGNSTSKSQTFRMHMLAKRPY